MTSKKITTTIKNLYPLHTFFYCFFIVFFYKLLYELFIFFINWQSFLEYFYYFKHYLNFFLLALLSTISSILFKIPFFFFNLFFFSFVEVFFFLSTILIFYKKSNFFFILHFFIFFFISLNFLNFYELEFSYKSWVFNFSPFIENFKISLNYSKTELKVLYNNIVNLYPKNIYYYSLLTSDLNLIQYSKSNLYFLSDFFILNNFFSVSSYKFFFFYNFIFTKYLALYYFVNIILVFSFLLLRKKLDNILI